MDRTAFIIVVVSGIALAYFFYGSKRRRLRRNAEKNKFRSSSIVTVLMNLKDESVKQLLELYRAEFGAGPARYARKTLTKWKTGEVQPASRTFERFLVRLPKVMSYDLKCEVLRHFMIEYAAKEDYDLEVYTDEWEEKLTPLIHLMVDKAYTAQLPSALEEKIHWLGDGDMQAAQLLLRRSQAEESKMMTSTLREEFDDIERLLAQEHLQPRVRHVLRFPYGTINLSIKRR